MTESREAVTSVHDDDEEPNLTVSLTPLQVETLIDILTEDIRAAAAMEQFEWVSALSAIGTACRLAQVALL